MSPLALLLLLVACSDDAGDSSRPPIGDVPAGDLAADAGPDLDAGARDAEVDETSGDAPDFDGGIADTVDEEVDSGPVPPDRPEITSERIEALRSQLDDIFANPSVEGRQLSALVVDTETGEVLYESTPDLALAPASNTKLFTTAAALALLGEDYRFHTRVFGEVAPDGSGVIDGDVYLVAEHDFTISSTFYWYESTRFPLDLMADDLYAQGVREVTGSVWVYGELVYDGNRFANYSPSAHRSAAATAFRQALLDRGISVGPADTSAAFEPPAGALLLTDWWSVPLSVACQPLNSKSHNEFADILLRHLGYVLGEGSTYQAGARVVLDWLADSGVATVGLAFNDGSGLSWDNRVSARHVVELLQLMRGESVGLTWERTLSVAGVRGTLANRLTGPDTTGRVFGKTGTLSIAVATSGFLVNRHDGRRYVFSFLMNNDSPIDRSAHRAVEDRAVEAIAVDLLQSGARPAAPELRTALSNGDGATATLSWTSVDGAEGYWVWRSEDGALWRRDEADYVSGPVHVLRGRSPSEMTAVRITAVNAAGESDPSDVYAVRVDDAPSALLLVDGNERWQRQPLSENTLGGGHDFLVHYAGAVDIAGFDSASNSAVVAGDVSLADYSAVAWALSEDSVDDDAFDTSEQALLAAYATAGGDLFITGAEAGYDLVQHGTSEDAAFYADLLRAEYVGDDANTFLVAGTGGIFGDLSPMGFLTPGENAIHSPDQLAPSGGSAAVLEYVGGDGGTAGLQYSGSYRLVYLGFPFESIDNAPDRATVMQAVLRFFDL